MRIDVRTRETQELPTAASCPDPELEAEVQAVAAWFDGLPADVQSYFDHEALSGRASYPAT